VLVATDLVAEFVDLGFGARGFRHRNGYFKTHRKGAETQRILR
jgi:hypothetical protein